MDASHAFRERYRTRLRREPLDRGNDAESNIVRCRKQYERRFRYVREHAPFDGTVMPGVMIGLRNGSPADRKNRIGAVRGRANLHRQHFKNSMGHPVSPQLYGFSQLQRRERERNERTQLHAHPFRHRGKQRSGLQLVRQRLGIRTLQHVQRMIVRCRPPQFPCGRLYPGDHLGQITESGSLRNRFFVQWRTKRIHCPAIRSPEKTYP